MGLGFLRLMIRRRLGLGSENRLSFHRLIVHCRPGGFLANWGRFLDRDVIRRLVVFFLFKIAVVAQRLFFGRVLVGNLFVKDLARDRGLGQLGVIQFLNQVGGRLIAIFRLLGHHSLNHSRQSLGNIRIHVARVGNRLDGMRLQFVGHASFRIRRRPRQHLIPGTPQRIQIAADVGQFAVARLLGRHVVDGANGGSGPGDVGFQGVVDRSGQAQVRHFDITIATNQQVRRLDVPVNDILFEGMLQPGGDLLDDVDRSTNRHDTAQRNHLEQVAPFDVFHGDVQEAIRFTAVEHGDNVRVAQLGRGLSLCTKPPDQNWVRGLVPRQDLQRHSPLQFGVAGQKHGPHAPRANFLFDQILAQALQLRQRWSCAPRFGWTFDRSFVIRSHL